MAKFSASPKTPPDVMKPTLEDTARQDPKIILGDFAACDAFDVRGRLKEIATPVLVVTGEEDYLTPPKYGEFLAANIKGARRVHVKDSGHMVPVEKPAELERA